MFGNFRYPARQIPSDLVVKCQTIDNTGVILQLIWLRASVQTSSRHRISRCEPLSPSQAHRFTTKSDGMWKPELETRRPLLRGLVEMDQRDSMAASTRDGIGGENDDLAERRGDESWRDGIGGSHRVAHAWPPGSDVFGGALGPHAATDRSCPTGGGPLCSAII